MTRNVPATVPSAEKPERRRPISKKVTRAIELMLRGKAKNITEAAAQIGMPRETLSRNLHRDDIEDQIRKHCRKALILAAPRAAAVKTDLMESDNSIVRERASSFVLSMIGIAPQQSGTSVNVSVDVRAGWVVDLSDDPKPVRQIEHEPIKP
ncbi:transposase-like protein [Bradyrhizobium sp. i1.3.1]